MNFENKLKILNPSVRKSFLKLIKELEKNINVLYELATIDEKTGAYNNKFFTTIAEIEIEKAKRGMPLSLMIIDLDNFKKLNDTYGHIAGDKALKQLTKVAKQTARKSDLFTRFGGEEFIILYPNTGIEKGMIAGNRIRKAIAEDKILKRYNVTMSGGMTEYKEKDTITKMKQRADKALYKAKHNGKNRVENE